MHTFNAERRIERIERAQRNDAHKLIEVRRHGEYLGGALCRKAKGGAIRIHDKPTTETSLTFAPYWRSWGWKLPGGNKPEPRDYAELLEVDCRPAGRRNAANYAAAFSKEAGDLRSGTAGTLARRCGLMRTLPRRFAAIPDLSLPAPLVPVGERAEQGNTTKRAVILLDGRKMLQLGQHCSMAERRADETRVMSPTG